MTRLRRLVTSLALMLFAAPLAAQAPAPSSPDQAPRIEAAEAKRLVEKGEAVLVDVRNKDAWIGGHAEGALHIPVDQVASRLKELPKDKMIAAYCT